MRRRIFGKALLVGCLLCTRQIAIAAPAAPEPAEPEPAASSAPREVRVAGNKLSRVAGAVRLINSKQLERKELDDPHAVLAAVPGVSTRGEDGYGLRPNIGIRGTATERSKKITITEDGILLGPAPYSAPAAYYFPLLTRMRAVRVLKGPAAIHEGPHTVGGAIDLSTRDVPAKGEGKLDLALGSERYAKLHGWGGGRLGRWGVLAEGVRIQSDGFKQLDGGGTTGFVRNEFMLKSDIELPNPTGLDHRFEVKLGYSTEDSDESYLGLTDGDFSKAPLRRYATSSLDHMSWYRTQVELRHRISLPRQVELQTAAYRHDFSRTWNKLNRMGGSALPEVLAQPDDIDAARRLDVLRGRRDTSGADDLLWIGPNERQFVAQGIQTRVDARAKTGPVRHHIVAGLRYHYDEIERHHSEAAYAMRRGKLERERSQGSPSTVTTAESGAHTHAVAMHIAETLFWDRLAISPGLRVEALQSLARDRLLRLESSASTVAWLPGVGATVEAYRDLYALAGVYRGFSPAVPEARPKGSEPLDPEYSINYEAGLRYAPKFMFAEAVAFYHDYQNLTDICTFAGGCSSNTSDRQYSAGAARVYGLEVSAHGEPALPYRLRLPFELAYTFMRGDFLRSFESDDPQFGIVTKGDSLPYLPAHQVAVTVGVGQARWEVSSAVQFVDRVKEQGGRGGPLAGAWTSALWTWDAFAHAQITPNIELYLSARNLLNAQAMSSRRPFGARPNAPRTVLAGLRLHLGPPTQADGK
jgi:Fe(3+) dicitrate transport protein